MNLQLFGGRGGGLRRNKKKRGGGSSSGGWTPFKVPRLSTNTLSKMGRSQLVTIARAVFVNNNVSRGMSPAEAARRFNLLESGNTTAQLRSYIKKYNR